MTSATKPAHPHPTDVVVVLPGILGSSLYAGDTPIWAPTPGALLRAIATLGRSITRHTLPAGIGDDHPGDGIIARGLLADVHAIPGIWTPVKGYDRLINKLTTLGYTTANRNHPRPPNLVLFPYDWRLSNRYNAHQLAAVAEPALERWQAQGGRYRDARLVFICHSMGGLIARWYLEHNHGWPHTRALITLGTPYRGAANALIQLVNGPPRALGRLNPRLAEFARSLPSLHQLLPEYACITTPDGQLLKTTETTLPELDTTMVTDAMNFHTTLQHLEAARPASLDATHTIVGTRQPTPTTITLDASHATAHDTIPDHLGNTNDYGDATVPLTGGIGHGLPQDTNRIHRVAEHHGNLQRNTHVLDLIHELLTTEHIRRRAPATTSLRAYIPDFITTDQPLHITADTDDNTRHGLTITITHENGHTTTRQPKSINGHTEATFTNLTPGAYSVDITGITPAAPVAPVSAPTIVWPTT